MITKDMPVAAIRASSHKASLLQSLFVPCTIAVALIYLYWPAIVWFVTIWGTDREYSHCFLVPLISGYLVWLKRDQLKRIAIQPAIACGSLTIILSIGILLAGRSGGIIQLEAVSLAVFLPGLVMLFLGMNFLKALTLPLLYLQFMVPWFDFLEPWIGGLDSFINRPFQIASAKLGATLLNILGFNVFQDQVYIQLTNITMEVARECSGLRFLASIVAIGLPLVYLTQKTWLRAGFVIGSSVLVTILVNGIRITLAGVLGNTYGPQMLHGPWHILQGWLVSLWGWAALFFLNWLVKRRPHSSAKPLFQKYQIVSPNGTSGIRLRHQRILIYIFLSALFMFLIYLHFYSRPKSVALNHPLSMFPYEIEQWRGEDSRWLDGKEYFPGTDEWLSRVYHHPDGYNIYLYIGYFTIQSPGKMLISYHSKKLHDRINNVDKIQGLTVNQSIIGDQVSGNEIFFWYYIARNRYTRRFYAKLASITEALSHGRNNGAVVIIGSNGINKLKYSQLHVAITEFLNASMSKIENACTSFN